MDTLLVLIPALPLAAALLVAALGRWLRERSHWPVVLGARGVVRVQLAAAVRGRGRTRRQQSNISVTLWTWADGRRRLRAVDNRWPPNECRQRDNRRRDPPRKLFDFDIDVTLRADALTAIMLAMVTFVCIARRDLRRRLHARRPGYWRFFAYIGLFVFSMTMLVSVSNFVLLYVFWEAVGVCSYLLIGFWYQKPEAAAAGKKAFLVNRVGDFGFALALFLIWTTYGTLNFHDTKRSPTAATAVVTRAYSAKRAWPIRRCYVSGGVALAICLLLLLGACGKSAQFPLHVWLPDAMEGPTPVSALIHAATMVTAGVYMVARCTPLFCGAVCRFRDRRPASTR